MTGMIERVARAIGAAQGTTWTDDFVTYANPPGDPVGPVAICRAAARAAIEAMREPTEGMVNAAWPDYPVFGETPQPIDAWPRMITAALSEGEG